MISSHLNNKNYNVNDAQIWTNQICDDVAPLPPRSSRTSPPSIRTSSSSPTASSCRRPTADSTSPAPASGTIRSTAPSPLSGTPPPSFASSTSLAAHSDLIHSRPIASSYHHTTLYHLPQSHIIPYIISSTIRLSPPSLTPPRTRTPTSSLKRSLGCLRLRTSPPLSLSRISESWGIHQRSSSFLTRTSPETNSGSCTICVRRWPSLFLFQNAQNFFQKKEHLLRHQGGSASGKYSCA